jgi:hypothetical protein
MKTLIILLLIILIALPVFAQEQTLFSGKIEHGGYGGPVVKFSSVNGEFGVLVGGHGGWIINHTLVLGGGGYGLVNNVKANTLGPLNEEFLDFGYGGFEVEWVMNSDKLVHFSIHTLIGGGGVQYRTEGQDITYRDSYNDGFLVLEPGATLDLNLTTWMRFSIGASYRYVNGVDSNSNVTSDQDLTGPSAMLMVRFGKF